MTRAQQRLLVALHTLASLAQRDAVHPSGGAAALSAYVDGLNALQMRFLVHELGPNFQTWAPGFLKTQVGARLARKRRSA